MLSKIIFSKLWFQESYRQEDLEKLHLLNKRDHMQMNNEYLHLFRSSKYVIKMARESFNVLKKHLQVKQQVILILVLLLIFSVPLPWTCEFTFSYKIVRGNPLGPVVE